jgi:hypothetical protein
MMTRMIKEVKEDIQKQVNEFQEYMDKRLKKSQKQNILKEDTNIRMKSKKIKKR